MKTTPVTRAQLGQATILLPYFAPFFPSRLNRSAKNAFSTAFGSEIYGLFRKDSGRLKGISYPWVRGRQVPPRLPYFQGLSGSP